MFQHLAGSADLRAPALVPVSENIDFVPFDARTGTNLFVVRIATRTTGTVVVVLRGSFDGGTTYEELKRTAALAANGVAYVEYNGPLPKNLRLSLIPAASFDGTVALRLRTGGSVASVST